MTVGKKEGRDLTTLWVGLAPPGQPGQRVKLSGSWGWAKIVTANDVSMTITWPWPWRALNRLRKTMRGVFSRKGSR